MKHVNEAIKIFFEKKNMIYFFKIYSVAFILSLISFVFSYVATKQGLVVDRNRLWIFSIPSIILFPISIWAQASGYESVKRVVGGGAFDFKDTYRTSWKYLGKFLLASSLVGLIVIGGIILLIVPGVIFGVWYAFSTWGVVGKNLKVRESLKESKKLVEGRFWKVLGQLSILLLFVLIVQTGFSFIPVAGPLIATIFGGLFLLPYYLMYLELASERKS